MKMKNLCSMLRVQLAKLHFVPTKEHEKIEIISSHSRFYTSLNTTKTTVRF